MEKIKLSVMEMVGLEAELNGLVNQENGEVVAKGLLGEKLDLVTKYRLKKLSDVLAAEKKIIDDLRQELTEKCIVICTYRLVSDNSEVDRIVYEYKNEYPQLEEVDVTTGSSDFW